MGNSIKIWIKMITLFTIGFTKKSAEKFFSLLNQAGVRKIVDIRLNNSSQLAGFAKGDDLRYFAKKICGAEYLHILDFAPTKELLKSYQDKETTWDEYVSVYRDLLEKRGVKSRYSIDAFDQACFLCTEDLPTNCHRRLLVEYFEEVFPDKDIKIIHLH